jgi:nucleotide-binding universal stress UspA family protein
MSDASMFDLGLADEVMAQAREKAAEIGHLIEHRFHERLKTAGISGKWLRVEAEPAAAFAAHARFVDLAIVGQNDPDRPFVGASVPVTAIMQSGRPVLVVPYTGDIKSVGHNILIGWKEGREATRAVNDALPLLTRARMAAVLTIDREDASYDNAETSSKIVLHLARHGVNAFAKHTVSDDVPDGDVILNWASDTGADLIVVGGYGHSRASEFVLGGVTRTLLKAMTVPVLFSH